LYHPHLSVDGFHHFRPVAGEVPESMSMQKTLVGLILWLVLTVIVTRAGAGTATAGPADARPPHRSVNRAGSWV
jgi:hypothetical protein